MEQSNNLAEERLQKRLTRERLARKQAEKLLEEKSLKLYQTNLNLEKTVKERTLELEKQKKQSVRTQQSQNQICSHDES